MMKFHQTIIHIKNIAMYLFEILSLISWPILIAITFIAAVKLINKFELKNNAD